MIELYLLYAFVQAVLFARFVVKDPDPVPVVALSFIFAPLVAIGLLLTGAWLLIDFLARPR